MIDALQDIDLARPLVLVLLPLALLPLLPLLRGRGGADLVAYPSVAWLPADRVGEVVEIVWRTLAAATIACIVAGLAGPGRSEARQERIGRGAELYVLLDRSSSMDATIRLPPPALGEAPRASVTKNAVVREALTELIRQRPDHRYALTLFNAAPIRVAPFGEDSELVVAGLAASGIGRGPSETFMDRALLAAIDDFAERDYTGSRAILLVSDGGARLDAETRERVRRGLARERIALYFVYIRSSPNSPRLERVSTVADTDVEEIALHVFFDGLDTEYRVYEADDAASMAEVVADIDARQNLPLTRFDRVPRIDLSHRAWWIALGCCAALAVLTPLRRTALAAHAGGRAGGRAERSADAIREGKPA